MHVVAKKVSVCLFSVSFLFFGLQAQAQDSDNDLLKEIRTTLNDLGAFVNNTVEEVMTMVADLTYTPTPTISDTMLVNLKYRQEAIPREAFDNSNRLTATMSLYLNPLSLHDSGAQRTYALMPSSAEQVSTQVPNFAGGSILNKTGFTSDSTDATYAQNFVNAIIDIDNTPKNLNFLAFNSLTNPGANYLTALASYISAQSVPINSLYSMFSKRIIIANLGKNAGMIRLYPLDENDTGSIGEQITDASPLQVDEYMSNRRIMNPKWYADMEAASNATVNREMLYVLAEIRSEMFKQRMMIEQLSANMSAFQLQEAQSENRTKFLIRPLS